MAEVEKHAGGRPTKMTPEVVTKLEEVFALDGTVEEACFYAGISRNAYYEWVKAKPELNDRFEELRQRPFLKARQTIVKNLDQPEHAKWYMERKKKIEFAGRTEMTGAEGKDLGDSLTDEEKLRIRSLIK